MLREETNACELKYL